MTLGISPAGYSEIAHPTSGSGFRPESKSGATVARGFLVTFRKRVIRWPRTSEVFKSGAPARSLSLEALAQL